MLLLLIRHGLTPHTNVRLTGWMPGVGLSPAGRAQASGLVQRLEGLPIDAIYSSPLERAAETAAPLARARRLRVRTRSELGEVRYGDLEGKSLKVLARSPMWARLRTWPSDIRFPGGESLRETQARAISAVERLRAQHDGGTIAVFSHGDFIRLALAHYLGVHIDLYRRLSVDTVSVSAIWFRDGFVQVRRLNETGTLSDLGGTPLAARLAAAGRDGARGKKIAGRAGAARRRPGRAG